MKILNLILVMAALILGTCAQSEAQVVRSQTHRSYRSHGVYTHPYSRPYYRYHPRPHYGFQVNIGYGTGYYGLGGYYSFYNHGPRFVHYPARCPAPCLPAALPPVIVAPAQTHAPPAETVTLKPGETRRVGDVVIANIDGKIVILQAEPANGE
jgi:hypothetical protein